MADLNTVSISGWLSKCGKTKGQYPKGWILLQVPDLQPRNSPAITQKGLFLSITLDAKSQDKMATLPVGQWLHAWDLSVKGRVMPDNSLRRDLGGSFSRIQVRHGQGPLENVCLLRGTVRYSQQDFFELGCSYLNPKETDPAKKWKEHIVRVYGDGLPCPPMNSRIYVRGRVSSQTPAFEECLCVLADVIA